MNTRSVAQAAGGRATIRTVVVRISRKLKAVYRIRSGRRFSNLLLALVAVLAPAAARALPQGVTVQAGQSSISTPTPNTMLVNQGTSKAVLNWNSYNIGKGESVRYVQPDASSVSLNRVTGSNPSSIFGSLTANGQVFLVNPNGVLFAPGAQVDVGGLVATTLNLSNSDFLAGKYNFTGYGGSVVNQGAIKAGYAVLAAPSVTNAGTIDAPGGSVGLLAGSRVSIDPAGDGMVKFSVDAAALNAAVVNSGTITADGGQVALSAQAVSDTLPTVINQSGVIRANSIANHDGTIVLSGGSVGIVDVSGSLQASGTAAGQTGGTVQVLGDRIALRGTSAISATGDAGGGTVLVGGNFHGAGPQQDATVTVVEKGASIDASATGSGAGGRLAIWSDRATYYAGDAKVRGAGQDGDGGFAEVSGKEHLSYTGSVDARGGPGGATGTLLLDPANIDVEAANPDINGDGTTGDDLTTNTLLAGDFPGANSVVTAGAVVTQLNAADVELQATHNVTINAAIDASGNAGAFGLKLDSTTGGSIIVNQPITLKAGNASGFTASSNAAGGGVLIGATVDSGGGPIAISANAAAQFKADLNAGAGIIDINAGQSTLASGGTLTFTGATVTVAGPVNASGAGDGLAVAGNLVTNTTLGASMPLDSLSVSGSSTLGGNVTTVNNQTYTGPVTLAADVVATSNNGGGIGFGNTIDGAQALTVTSSGAKTFSGAIGGGTPLTSFTANGGGTTLLNGGAVTTNGATGQVYGDAVTLGADTTLSAGTGAITFNGTIDGTQALTVTSSGAKTFDGVIGGGTPLTSFTANGSGTTLLNGGAVTTNGATGQVYGDAVTLGADTTLTAGTGAITFNGTLNGGHVLGLNTSGATTLAATVGGVTPLTSITTDAGGTTDLGASITTSGAQTYNDDATLISATTLKSAGNAAITLQNVTGGSNDLTLTTTGGVTGLALSNLGELTLSNGTNLGATSVAANSASLGGNVTTTGALGQNFGTSLVMTNDISLDSGAPLNPIDTGAVTGNGHNLTLTGDACVCSGSGIGAVVANDSFSNVGTVSATSVTVTGQAILSGNVTTSGPSGQTYGSLVVANADIHLDSTGGGAVAGGANISTGPVAGNGNILTINAGTGGVFSTGVVTNLDTLTVTNSGSANLNGQYGDASVTSLGPVTIDGATTVTNNLVINAGGAITQTASAAASGLQLLGNGSAALTNTGNNFTTVAANMGGDVSIANSGTLTVGTVNATSGITSGGNVTLTADNMAVNAPVSGTNVTLQPITAGQLIDLGGADAAGTLGLTSAEIDNVTASGTLTVGSSAAGDITVSAPIAPTGASTLSLRTGGAVVNGAGADITVTNLAIRSVNGVATGVNPLATAVSNLAFDNTGAGGVSIANTGALSIASVDGLTASSAGTGALALSASSPITVSSNIIQAGDITLTATETANPGDDITINPGITVQSTAGNVTLSAGDNIALGAGSLVQSTAASGIASLAAGVADLDGIGAISGSGLVAAPNVALDGFKSVGASGARISTSADTLAARTTTAGGTGVFVSEADAVTLNTVGSVGNGAAGGGAYDVTAGGTITAAGAVNNAGTGSTALSTTGANTNNIVLSANVGNASAATVLTSIGNITGTGIVAGTNVTLDSATGVGTGTAGRVSTQAGTLAARSTTNGGVFVSEADAVTLNTIGSVGNGAAGAGAYDVTAAGTVTVGGAVNGAGTGSTALSTTGTNTDNIVLNANVGNTSAATVLTSVGNITGGGIVAGTNVTLDSATGVGTGTSGRVSTQAGTLAARSTTGGGVFVSEADAVTLDTIGAVSNSAAGGGAYDLTAGGTISVNGPLSGGNVSLTATGTGHDIDLNTGPNATGTLTLTAGGTSNIDSTITAQDLVVNGAASLGSNVTTGATQTYNGPVTLATDSTLASSGGGAIDLASTVDGAHNLAVNTTGTTTFGGAVGGTTPLTSVTTNAGGATDVNGGSIVTSGGQTYNDDVGLSADTTLQSTGNAAIALQNVTGNGHDLTLTTTGGVSALAVSDLDDLVLSNGSNLAASSLVTNAASLGGNVTTTGSQQYFGAVSLTNGVTLQGAGVTFENTGSISGAQALTVNTTGSTATTFDGPVNIGSLSTNADGTTNIGANITTSGTQTYADPVTLTASSVLQSTGNSLISLQNVDGGGDSLTLTTTGGASAAAMSNLGNLTLTSGTNLSATSLATNTASLGGNVATTSTQGYGGAVSVTGPVTASSSGNGAITFSGTVDGAGPLTVTTGGLTTFAGAVGGTTPLSALTTNGGGTTDLNANVTTAGTQTYTDNAVLSTNVLLTGPAVNFGGTVDGQISGAQSLTTSGGTTSFASTVGQATPLASVTTGGPTTLGGNVTTVGAQDYNGAVTLAANSTLASNGNNTISVTGAVNGTAGTENLTVNTTGATVFGSTIGATTPLGSLTTDAGGTTSLGGSVTTTNGQTYGDNVILTGDVVADSAANAPIAFNGTIDGAHALTVTTSGLTTIGGVVGGGTPLTTLTTNGGGTTDLNANVTTTGAQTYTDNVMLSANELLTGPAVNFGGTVEGTVAGAQSLTTSGGITSFASTVGAATSLASLTTGGATTVTGNVTTAGAQSYGGALTVAASGTLASTNNNAISITGAVNGTAGTENLTVNTTGATVFGSTIGATTPLGSLTTNAGGTSSLGGNVTTANGQTYGDNVTLAANVVADSTANAPIAFNGTIDGAHALTVTTSGLTTIAGAVGGGTALTALNTNGGGTTDLNANVTTTGAQTYTDNVVLSANELLTGPAVNFGGTVEGTVAGAQSLTTSGGSTSFGNTVGATTPLSTIATGGATTFTGDVTTTGVQSYAGPVTVAANTILSNTGNNNITLSGPVNSTTGAQDLTVISAGTSVFGSTVGATTPLHSLTTDAAGTTSLAGNVTTNDGQTYNDNVTLANNVTATSVGSGAIAFRGTIDGAHGLTLTTAGLATLLGTVGGTTPLTSLTTNGGGTTDLNANVTTSGAQTYTDNVVLSANELLTGPAVNFGGTVEAATAGGESLTTGGGSTAFGSTVGAATPLSTITTGGATTFTGDVTTTGAQSYAGQVTVAANTILSNSGNNNITLTGPVNSTTGAQDLTVISAGATVFGNTVGATTGLHSLTTDAAGTTQLAGNVTTSGAQTYNDPVTLAGDVTATGSQVQFTGTVDGAFALSTNGQTVFNGAVGAVTPLTSLSTGGPTSIGANISTQGSQTYGGATTVAANSLLASSNGGAIFFGGTVDGDHDLTTTTTGQTTFFATVGGTTPLDALNVDGGGDTGVFGNVTTASTQNYAGNLDLGNNVTLTGSGVTVGGTLAGLGRDLSLQVGSGTANIASAVSLGTLTFHGGDLTSTGALNADTYNLQGGTVDATLGIGTFNPLGNTINVLGNTTLNGTEAAPNVNVSGGTLTLGPGTNRLAGATSVTIANGAALNTGSASQQVGPSSDLATITDAGTLQVGGTLIAGDISNSGTVNVGPSATMTAGNVGNTGNLNVGQGASLNAASISSPGVLTTGSNASLIVANGITATNANDSFGDGTLFSLNGPLNVLGDFAGSVLVDGNSSSVNITDTSASTLTVAKMHVASNATVTLQTPKDLEINTPQLSPVSVLNVTAPKIDFNDSDTANKAATGSPGVIATKVLNVTITTDGSLNSPNDPMFIHPNTPSVLITNATTSPKNFWIAGNVNAYKPQAQISAQANAGVAAIYAETARFLLDQLRADAGLLNVEKLVLFGGLPLEAVTAPLSFPSLEIKLPKCVAEQKSGAGC